MRPNPKHHKKPSPSANALVPVTHTGTEIALPDALIQSARGFAKHSRSERTRIEYGLWWKDFVGWCDAHGRDSLPASPNTVIAYITYLAEGRGGTKKPLAVASISVAMAAIKLAHRTKKVHWDSDNEDIKSVMKGIRRESAKVRTVRRVKPLMKADLSDMLDNLRSDNLREARDAAVLALGWAGALRRSELVGLDWQELGTTPDKHRTGFVNVDEKGIVITLMTSKASQDTAQDIIIPIEHAHRICTAVDNWKELAKIQRGEPLFRGILGKAADGKKIAPTRLLPQSVANLIKRRIHVLIQSRSKGRNKMSREDIAILTAQYAGHSMRAGYVSSAANEDMPTHRIAKHTRHKTEAMVGIYARDSDIRKNSGLKGVGF